jgi:hypothetical protein
MHAPKTFQRMLDDFLMHYLHEFVTVYLNDMCIYKTILKERLKHMRLAL